MTTQKATLIWAILVLFCLTNACNSATKENPKSKSYIQNKIEEIIFTKYLESEHNFDEIAEMVSKIMNEKYPQKDSEWNCVVDFDLNGHPYIHNAFFIMREPASKLFIAC